MAKVFTHRAQLRFSDTDSMGHINNARFLSYIEDARIAFLAEIAMAGEGFLAAGLIVARIEIDYVQPLQLSATPVDVEAWLTRIGTKSFGMDYRIIQSGATAARATSVLVTYDYAAAASRSLTAGERAALTTWLG